MSRIYKYLLEFPYMDKCEKCSENGHYVVELNRNLCPRHAKEFSARHELWSESIKAMESIVFDMTYKYQYKLDEKEISEILQDVSQKVFDKNQIV